MKIVVSLSYSMFVYQRVSVVIGLLLLSGNQTQQLQIPMKVAIESIKIVDSPIENGDLPIENLVFYIMGTVSVHSGFLLHCRAHFLEGMPIMGNHFFSHLVA